MKTSIKNLFATALTLVILTSTTFAATDGNQQTVTELKQVKNINKIEVSGNVEVIIIQSPVESVKVYDSYYSKNALVQQKENVLRISSFQKETLTVAVYVRDLNAITASENASVKTLGKVNFLSLAVTLSGDAKAAITANTVNLATSIKDNACLSLAGTTSELFATLGSRAKLSMDTFKADASTVNSIAPVYAKIQTLKKQTLESIILTDELAK